MATSGRQATCFLNTFFPRLVGGRLKFGVVDEVRQMTLLEIGDADGFAPVCSSHVTASRQGRKWQDNRRGEEEEVEEVTTNKNSIIGRVADV